MDYCGFSDEAASDLPGQIQATKELGWRWIESRNVDGVNLHDLDQAAFDRAVDQLGEAGIGVACFGSAIANWSASVMDGEEKCLAQTTRAVARMRRLGTKLIRIMSFQVIEGRGPDDQMIADRIRILRGIVARFTDAGLTPVHENCMNYGGMGASYTLRLIAEIPGLKLVFDTGNPVFTDDRDARPDSQGRLAKQSSWDFWRQVRDHVAHIHVKDGIWAADGAMRHTFPGEGNGDVIRVLSDALARGYDGFLSIEPHLAVVHHDPAITAPEAIRMANYLEYGRRTEALIRQLSKGFPG